MQKVISILIFTSSILLQGCSTTPISAAKNHNYDALEELTKTPGTDFNKPEPANSEFSKHGDNAITYASKSSRALEIILQRNTLPKIDIGSRGEFGRTALHYAAIRHNTKNIKLLLNVSKEIDSGQAKYLKNSQGNLKSYVNALDWNGKPIGFTPLCAAANSIYKPKLESFKLLIDSGADIDAECFLGRTVLNISIEKNYFDVAELLINYGAKVTDLNYRGETALHSAVKNYKNSLAATKWVSVKIKQQIQASNLSNQHKKKYLQAYLDHRNNKGETAYFISEVRDKPKTSRLIRKLGATTDINDFAGKTADERYEEREERAERKRAARNQKKSSSSSDIFMQALVIGAGVSVMNDANINKHEKTKIQGAFINDVMNDTGGTNLNTYTNTVPTKTTTSSDKQKVVKSSPQKEYKFTYTCPTPGSKSKTVDIPYRKQVCLNLKKKLVSLMSCNIVNHELEEVKQNCKKLCNNSMCLEPK